MGTPPPRRGTFGGTQETSPEPLGSGERGARLVLRVQKKPLESSYEIWYGILVGHRAAPTVRFGWEQWSRKGTGGTRQLLYSWEQTSDLISVVVVVPTATTKRDISVDFAPDGRSWRVQIASAPDLGVIKGRFWGVVRPDDSSWFLVSDEKDGKVRISS